MEFKEIRKQIYKENNKRYDLLKPIKTQEELNKLMQKNKKSIREILKYRRKSF